MKHLRKFENFYLPPDVEEENKDQEGLRSLVAGRNPHDTGRPSIDYTKKTEFRPEHDLGDVVRGRMKEDDFDNPEEDDPTMMGSSDSTMDAYEKKKIPAGLRAYLDKKKKSSKTTDKKKNFKPDFPDLDKDGDKKEPISKAAREAKAKKK
jgi:hypothetical protein